MGMDPNDLQIGQIVTVQELTYGLQIRLPEEGETGLTVVEISREHVVLDDSASGIRRSIPLYLIRKEAPAPVKSSEAA